MSNFRQHEGSPSAGIFGGLEKERRKLIIGVNAAAPPRRGLRQYGQWTCLRGPRRVRVKPESLVFMIVVFAVNMGGFIAAMISALKDNPPKN